MTETKPKFKLEAFEGPLDLLLSLITKNKIDICDIPISLILDQYMEYLSEMEKMDMDIAGEFIAMASELMLIKSRMLFPKTEEEDEEDPRAALAAALLEYKKAKEAAVLLNGLYYEYSGRFAKDSDEFPPQKDAVLEDQDAELLKKAFVRLINRSKLYSAPPEKVFAPLLKGRMVSVSERIIGIIKHLKLNGTKSFEYLMLLSENKSSLVASFMAILELLKAGRITLEEKEDGEILVTLNTRKVKNNDTE
ncbi:MAG: segregation/condensation protein A [Clostridia bacterium]|nr:segregation/condensation protein A [Clostridia bacterium]